jgi:hypothetical protein
VSNHASDVGEDTVGVVVEGPFRSIELIGYSGSLSTKQALGGVPSVGWRHVLARLSTRRRTRALLRLAPNHATIRTTSNEYGDWRNE